MTKSAIFGMSCTKQIFLSGAQFTGLVSEII